MIKPKDRDLNRSRDVEGPKLLRSKSGETNKMGEEKNVFGQHPTGTLSKHSLSELHDGEQEKPLVVTGGQKVVESSPMGQDSSESTPVTRKGKAPREEMGSRAPKGGGRSIAKDMMYAEKKKMK
jgi:hypothetical protein